MSYPTCQHPRTRSTEPYAFTGPVSHDENRAAHGSISYTQTCLTCGAERAVNQNQSHYEYGDWGPSRTEREADERAVHDAQHRAPAPAIASPSDDGTAIYAGIMRGADGQPDYHLWLLTTEPDTRLNWSDADAWALERGAALPTRREQQLLGANLPEYFASAWYWSGEQSAGDDAYAWSQLFSYGGQDTSHKSFKRRVRAVRRSVIQ